MLYIHRNFPQFYMKYQKFYMKYQHFYMKYQMHGLSMIQSKLKIHSFKII